MSHTELYKQKLIIATDVGTYKEDYPWSQKQLRSYLENCIGRGFGNIFVTVRPSCELDMSEYKSELVGPNDSYLYHMINRKGDNMKWCRLRLV